MTSFFRLAASALAVGGVAVSAVAPAQAVDLSNYTYRPGGGTINGYVVEGILESGTYSEPDYIEIYGPAGKEEIVVLCSPFDWQSTGPNSATFVDGVARSWCF